MILFTILQWIIIIKYCKPIVYCGYVHVDMAIYITLECPDTNNVCHDKLFARHSIAVLRNDTTTHVLSTVFFCLPRRSIALQSQYCQRY